VSAHGRIGRAGGSRVKRALGVQAALEWAFRVEQAQLELPPPKDVTEEGFGFGLEYVLLQRAVLGCKVDGGQHKMGSYSHPDAEVIAATVAGMPDSLGGIRTAIRVAELARAGLTPDWMPGAVPRCVPEPARHASRHCRRRHRTHQSSGPHRARHVENYRPPRLPGHMAASSGADRVRPARLWGLVAGAGLGSGWADRVRDAAGGGGYGGDAKSAAVAECRNKTGLAKR
jgi:hypothetical protein